MNAHQFSHIPTLPDTSTPRFPSESLPLHPSGNGPQGVIAQGGRITPEWLLAAYRQGIFPWYDDGHPILWWSPEPRCVLFTDRVRLHRSLRKTMKKPQWHVRFNTRFADVLQACATTPRRHYLCEDFYIMTNETWLNADLQQAYLQLHEMGHAHSVEVYWEDELVGGLYGMQLGQMFFGESMFHHRTDASKIALVTLCHHLRHHGFPLIDCQVENNHLLHMGAELIPRTLFERQLTQLIEQSPPHPLWQTPAATPQQIATGAT